MLKRIINKRGRRNGVRWMEDSDLNNGPVSGVLWRLDREMEAHLRQTPDVPVIPGGSRLWTPEDELPPTPPHRSQAFEVTWKFVVAMLGMAVTFAGFWCSAHGYLYNSIFCWMLGLLAAYVVVPDRR